MPFLLNLGITKPEQNQEIKGSQLTVKGVAIEEFFVNDPDNVVSTHSVDLSISVTGSGTKQQRGKKGDWSQSFTVAPGPKTITVRGTTSNNTRTITRNIVVVDQAGPVIKIDQPSEGEKFEGPGPNYTVKISGTTTDQSNIQSVQFRVGNSGSFRNVVKDSGSAKNWKWSKEITGLKAKKHTVHVRGVDQHGNTRAASRTFTTFRDSEPPIISINSPETTPTITWNEGGVDIDVSGTAIDTTTSVKSVRWHLDDDTASKAAVLSGANWNFTANIPSPGLHTLTVVATDLRDNKNSDTVSVDVAIPFEHEDIGYAPYLADLMSFTRRRVRQIGGSESIESEQLRQAFHQHYDRLALADFSAVATKPVAQVRIAVEVLRRFLSNSDSFPAYLESAYRLLLTNLGTSFAEIRLSRTADDETREALAARLGIALTGLDTLFIAPDELSEAKLQTVFGLIDTTQDPLILAGHQAQLLTLKLSHLQQNWSAQEQRSFDSLDQSSDLRVPAIDPDIIGQQDLKNAIPGNTAHEFLVERQQWVVQQLAKIKQARESENTATNSFAKVKELIFGDLDLADLLQQYQDGGDIEASLKENQINQSEFLTLIGYEKLAKTGVVTEGEWVDLYNLLLQAAKRREYKVWVGEELAAGISVEPSVFVRGDTRPELIQWRSSWRARRNWERRLKARSDQRDALKQAHEAAIESTEAAVLPMLRDRLIDTIDRQGFPDADMADWLTRRLSISFKYSGDQRLSRLEQAVETLQDLLLSSRSGRLGKLTRLPIGTETPQWELALDNSYTESDFDEEWQWMGSFATWQGAMFAFGYPENYLLPTLRDKSEWTPAFKELVKAVRQAGRLTAAKADVIAQDYIATLNQSVIVDIELTSQHNKASLKALQQRSKNEADADGQFPNHLEEIFFFVPMFLASSLQRKGEYLAALDWYQTVYAYELPRDERKIYFGLVAEESIRTEFRRSPDTWLLDGLDVFKIAGDRANALTRFTLLSISRCYLAFADAEFTRESNESIPFARRLYSTAQELLGLLEVPAPIAHWSFDQDDGSDAQDVTDNGHTLKLVGTNFEEAGLKGGAMAFDGNSEAQAASAPALKLADNGGDYSISMAFFLESANEIQTLIKKGAVNSGSPSIKLLPNDNRIRYQVRTENGVQEGASDSSLALDQWTHLACVKQGQLLRLFINGQFDSEFPLQGESVGSNGPLFIGNEPQGNGVNALFDSVQLFDQALSTDAVIELADVSNFPANPVVDSLQRRVDLSLGKLRNGLNIAGMERIRSAPVAAELVISDGGLVPPASNSLRPTAYRYSALIDRAKQLVSIAQQIEANFFSVLEKRDAEAYTLLNAQHDVQLTKETVELQDIRIKEADSSIELMTLHQDRAQTQFDTYNEWIDAGANQYERDMLKNYADLNLARDFLAKADAEQMLANAIVTATSADWKSQPAALGIAGGLMAGALFERTVASFAVNSIEANLKRNELNANLERRKDEWRLQSALANKDADIATQQIFQAGLNKLIVEQERAIAGIRADQALAVVEFLNNKFTNVELYEWMSDILSEIYSYFLQQATAMAQLASNQLAFERQQRPPAFIRSDYWQAPNDGVSVDQDQDLPDRRGLTGSARLLQDIYQLDQHAFETNKRKLQLVESFSLAKLFPFEFQQFRETGVLPFSTNMSLFDQGFPGHYLRLIKRARVSVVGLIPSTQGIRASLSAAGVSHVVTEGDVFRRTEVRRPSEMIAFTSPSNATGLFELQAENELLMPFETMGVDASWELQLPKAANRFNFDSIADVIFTLEYTALHSADYRHEVVQNLDRSFSAERAYSIKQDFPDLWYQLHHPETLIDEDNVIDADLKIERVHFSPNLEHLAVDQLIVYFVPEEGSSVEVEVAELRYQEEPSTGSISFGGASSTEGVISTRRGNASGWLPLIGKSPVATWTLSFANTQEFQALFDDERISDILFVVGYSGETPEWA